MWPPTAVISVAPLVPIPREGPKLHLSALAKFVYTLIGPGETAWPVDLWTSPVSYVLTILIAPNECLRPLIMPLRSLRAGP